MAIPEFLTCRGAPSSRSAVAVRHRVQTPLNVRAVPFNHVQSGHATTATIFFPAKHSRGAGSTMKQPDLSTEIDMFGRMMIALEEIEACREFVALIPEVRTNMVFARPHAKTPGEVMAVDGRITLRTACHGLPGGSSLVHRITWHGSSSASCRQIHQYGPGSISQILPGFQNGFSAIAGRKDGRLL